MHVPVPAAHRLGGHRMRSSSATVESPGAFPPQLSALAFSHSEMVDYSMPPELATMPEP